MMRIGKRRSAWAIGCLLLIVTTSRAARADILYDQPPTVGSGYYYTWTSAYTDSSLNYYLTLDNFSLAANSTVTGINWQGMYLAYDPSTGSTTNGAPNTGNWDFAIYTSGGSSSFPFTFLTSQTVSAADVTETLAGTTQFGSATVDYYNESVQLPSGFQLQGNQTYYIAIFSDNSGSANPMDSWSWMSGTGGDGSSYQYSSQYDQTYTRQLDRTFTLLGSSVPEPSSLILGAIGAVCLTVSTLARRRISTSGVRGFEIGVKQT